MLLDSLHSVVLVQALGPGAQEHLLQARRMQALSFTVHLPLVCFGIAPTAANARFDRLRLITDAAEEPHRRAT